MLEKHATARIESVHQAQDPRASKALLKKPYLEQTGNKLSYK